MQSTNLEIWHRNERLDCQSKMGVKERILNGVMHNNWMSLLNKC